MKTTCPNCGQHFEIESGKIGCTTQCTSCGKDFVIQPLQENQALTNPPEPVMPNTDTTTSTHQDLATSTLQAANTTVSVPQTSPAFIEQPAAKMKTLTCEMCGSTNLIKQDGVFVCQSCGTKYSIEEAKKMMIAGTVSVAGTVSIDSSEQVKNLILQGNRFLRSEEYEEAENAFSKVLAIESNNLDAQLGKGIASGWQSDFGKPRYTAVNATMEFLLSNNLPQNVLAETISKLLKAFNEMSSTRYDDINGEYRRRVVAGASENINNALDGRLLAQRHDANADLKNYIRDYAKFVSALAKSGDKLLAQIDHNFAVQNFREDYKETRRLMTYYYSAVLDKDIGDYVPQDVINMANSNAGRNLEILKQLDPNVQVQQNNSGVGFLLKTWGIVIVCVLILFLLGSC
ncbi:MAG: hypothetical protein K5787_12990 [Lentisphaeria bacterium]|nr:hypothetical protein [Lentisphaeria bacterium]